MKKNVHLLTIILCLIFTANTYTQNYSGGSGTEFDPYIIATRSDLIELSNSPEHWIWDQGGDDMQYHFKQTANLIFDSDSTQVDWDGDGYASWDAEDQKGFSPIGNMSIYTRFEGVYDGQGHTIENLYIKVGEYTDYIGLFGITEGATIKNLGIVNCYVSGDSYVGALVGSNAGYYGSTVSNCYSTGIVIGDDIVGGLVGCNSSSSYSSTVEESYSTCNVEASESSSYAGGLVGRNDNSSSIINSHSAGNVTGNRYTGGLVGENIDNSIVDNCYSESIVNGSSHVGGLAGRNYENSTLKNSHSNGSVDGSSSSVGGLAGENNASTIDNCYSMGSVSGNYWVGGLVGLNENSANIINSYSLSNTTSGTTAGGLVGKNTNSSISSCFSAGNTIGSWSIGGFLGDNWDGDINNCYSKGDAIRRSGVTDTDFGGFCGDFENGTIENCYSIGSVIYEDAADPTGKGFLGEEAGTNTFSNNFFDSEASNQNTDAIGSATAKTTAAMKSESTFTNAGWDFMGETANGTNGYWDISDAANNGYPRLSWLPVVFTAGQTWTGTDDTDSVVIKNGNVIVTGTKANEECSNLTILSNGNLTIETGGGLTVHNNMVIHSDTTTGSLIDYGTLTVNGTSTIELYQSSTTTTPYWHYAAVPVDVSGGAITSSVFGTPYTPSTTDYYAFYWDEANQQYVSIEDDVTVLSEQMRGYAIPSDSTNTLVFEGSVVTGTQSITPTFTGSTTYSGFNLCGNPYPSGIDLATTSTMTGITNTNLDETVWIREDGNFITYNWASGTSAPAGFDGVIPPMQAFWVKVADGQASGALEFTNDARIHDNDMVYKETTGNIFRLSATLGERSDEMIVGFYKNASNGFDAYDSEKMFTDNNEFPQVYSIVNNKDLAINGLNCDFNNQVVVPLAYKVSAGGELTLKAINIDMFAPRISVYLEDHVEDITIDLGKESTYSFTANAPANITNRFELIFTDQTTGIEEPSNDFNIYTSDRTVYLNCNKNQNAEVFVYDITGRVIQNNKLPLVSGLNSFELNPTSNGIYFITVNLANRTVTEKVIIK